MPWREDAHINKLRLGELALVQNVQTETVTEAKTLTKADNGKVLIMSAAGGAAITLPAPLDGLRFKFVVGLAFATTDWVVGTNGGDNIIEGVVLVNGASVVGANEDAINFVASAETVGDWAEVVSDGTSWFVSGVGSAIGGITLTAV